MLDLTLLSEKQIFGDNRLEIFEKYGTECVATDFSILLGSYISSYVSNKLNNRTGNWWTKTDCLGDVTCVYSIYPTGNIYWSRVNLRTIGARPALPYSSIEPISSNKVKINSGIKEVIYGEYPQWIVDENNSNKLEIAYNNGSLKTTGKKFTTDSVECQETSTSFKPRVHTEYKYNGEKYIRFVGDSNCDGKVLSDGRTIKIGQEYWIHVEPIIWLVDEKNDIALSKYMLFSGVQFNMDAYTCIFDNTNIKRFMDNYLSKEIIVSTNILNTRRDIKTNSIDDIDSIFETAIARMNGITKGAKIKVLK